MKFIGKKQSVKKFQLYLKNYDFCEYVKFGAISLKLIFYKYIVTAYLKFESKSSFAHMLLHNIVIIWRTLHFVST